MKINFVSHSSIVIQTSDVAIWTDPWLSGKAFNDSWSMWPQPVFNEQMLDMIHYIWISHEHPDHFHIETLKSLPENFRNKVTILFQKNNSSKMTTGLNRLGFSSVKLISHRQKVPLTEHTEVYCYQVGQMDSCLGVLNNKMTILDINDAEVVREDCQNIVADIGKIDCDLNQFSIGGYPYGGYDNIERHLSEAPKEILSNVVNTHCSLGAKVTIPIASMVYYSCHDNKYLNQYTNKPIDIFNKFKSSNLQDHLVVLYPGETYEVGSYHDSNKSLERYNNDYSKIDELEYTEGEVKEFKEIKNEFDLLIDHLYKKYPKLIFTFMKPVSIYVPDIETSIVFDFKKKMIKVSDIKKDEADLVVYSQPLWFAFKHHFGFQTLAVSGRLQLQNNFENWKLYRILSSMNNAEVYLKPRLLFSISNLIWLSRRFPGLYIQLRRRLKAM